MPPRCGEYMKSLSIKAEYDEEENIFIGLQIFNIISIMFYCFSGSKNKDRLLID